MRSSAPCLGLVVGISILMLTGGCASHRVATGHPPSESSVEPARAPVTVDGFRIAATPDPLLGTSVWNAETLYQEAQGRYDARDFPTAVTLLGRLLEEFPDSGYVAPALLLRGMSQQELRELEAAATDFRRYLVDYPQGSQRWFAWRGLGDVHAAQQDWAASEQDLRTLLSLPDVPVAVADSARARLGRALVEQGKLDEASPLLEDAARRHSPTARLADGMPDDSDTGALARFYIGEIARRRAEAIVLHDVTDLSSIETDLERKAELTLEAHQHYYRTFSYGNPVWTAAAAFRMGYIYERFYQDVMEAPLPEGLSDEDAGLYREMLDAQLVNVVKRAYDLYGQVVRNAAQLNLEEEWVARCREGISRLEQRVQRAGGEAAPAAGPAPAEAPGVAEPPSSGPSPEAGDKVKL